MATPKWQTSQPPVVRQNPVATAQLCATCWRLFLPHLLYRMGPFLLLCLDRRLPVSNSDGNRSSKPSTAPQTVTPDGAGPRPHFPQPTEGNRLQIEAHQALQYDLTQVAMLYLFEWQLTVAWLEPFCSAAPVGAGDLPPRCGLAASDRPLPPKFQPPTRPASWPVARMGFSCREDTPRVDWIVVKPDNEPGCRLEGRKDLP